MSLAALLSVILNIGNFSFVPSAWLCEEILGLGNHIFRSAL
jgi:hypothetical protein